MNIYQRIVLIVGAIALCYALITIPFVAEWQGHTIMYSEAIEDTVYKWLYCHTDYGLAALRGSCILAVTTMLFFALGGVRK